MLTVRFAGSLPKPGQASASNEDRLGYRVLEEGTLRAAVADGATSMLFSGEWAELLTTAFVTEAGNIAALPALEPLQRQWFARVQSVALPWHQQLQVSQGAAAAFVGVTVAATGEWSAVGVGDCALFQVQRNQCVAAFPFARSSDVTNLPTLLLTHPESTQENLPLFAEGVLEPGDSLYLMSDALAAWFIAECEDVRTPWRWIENIQAQHDFVLKMRALNETNRLKEDDVTLIHVVYTGEG